MHLRAKASGRQNALNALSWQERQALTPSPATNLHLIANAIALSTWQMGLHNVNTQCSAHIQREHSSWFVSFKPSLKNHAVCIRGGSWTTLLKGRKEQPLHNAPDERPVLLRERHLLFLLVFFSSQTLTSGFYWILCHEKLAKRAANVGAPPSTCPFESTLLVFPYKCHAALGLHRSKCAHF